MTDIAATPRPSSGLAALFRHGRYVIGENKVTGFAFGLFIIIVLAAVIGPYIVPHDPLASDTAAALKASLGEALVRHRPARPRRVQPRRRRHAARLLHRGRLGRPGVPDGRARRRRRRLLRRLDRPHRRPHRRHHHGIPAVRAGHGHRRGARQHRAEHHPGHRDRELPALRPRRPRRSQRPPRGRLRAGRAAVRQRRIPHPAGAGSAEHHADHDRADVADHGLRHPQRRRPVVHRSGRPAADRGVGDHGGGGRGLHGVRRMVDRVLPRAWR